MEDNNYVTYESMTMYGIRDREDAYKDPRFVFTSSIIYNDPALGLSSLHTIQQLMFTSRTREHIRLM